MTRPDLGEQFDPNVVRLIAEVTIVTRTDLWADDVRQPIVASLREAYGRVPSLEDLARRFGDDMVRDVVDRTVKERMASLAEWSERHGFQSPCHFCTRPRREDGDAYPFGLAHSVVKTTHWGGALAALAANVVTAPLGMVVWGTPGSTTTAHIAHCRLVMCDACGPKCHDRFGGWLITERECRYHPSWERLYRAGFMTFLNHEELARYRPR